MFKIVFGWYLVLAIIVTSLQLFLEFKSINNIVGRDLVSLTESFGPSMAEALWSFNRPLISSMVKGISQSPIVTGILVDASQNKVSIATGKISKEDTRHDFWFVPAFQHITIPLDYRSSQGTERLGKLTIYSDREIVFNRVKESFILIVVNSLIKTAGLWIIFYLVISRCLSRPLENLEQVIAQIEFAPEASEIIHLEYPHKDELGRLINAMKKMQKKLIVSFNQLERANHELEVRVAERTRSISEALNFSDTILLTSPLAMGVYKASGECVLVNDAYAKLVGANHEELLAQNFYNITAWATSQLIDDCKIALNEHCSRSRELSVVTSFGKTVWVEVKLIPTQLDNKPHLLFQFIDLTDRKRNEIELIRAKECAEAATRAKSEFLANMSHEIRTPMSAILGLTQVISKTPLTKDQRECVEKILESGRLLLSIINDILDLSKVEAGLLKLDKRSIYLRTIIESISTIMEVSAQEKGLKTRITIAENIPDYLVGDDLRLQQILINLTGNAIKFTKVGNITVNIVAPEVTPESVLLRFEIIDTGIGIAANEIAKLFTPFTQVDTSTARRFGGTGLGLAICRRLVDLMGGEIGVESVEGEGSTFWFTARLGRCEDTNQSAVTLGQPSTWSLSPNLAQPFRLKGLSILVVEDNSINQDVARRILEMEGAKVEIASDGTVAITLLQNFTNRYDIVLMDVQMPVMGGYEATNHIRQKLRLSNIPIIALSAGVMTADRHEALAAGMDDFVPKPFNAEFLIITVAKHCGRLSVGGDRCPSPLNQPIGAFDPEETLRRSGGNKILAASLLARFVDQFSSVVFDLTELLDVGNHQDAIRCIHTLRGVAGNIGAQRLRDCAEEFEIKLRTDIAGVFSHEIANLAHLVDEAVQAIATYASSATDMEVLPQSTGGQHFTLADFKRLLNEYDILGIDAFEYLRAQISSFINDDEFNNLKSAIYKLEFSAALSIMHGRSANSTQQYQAHRSNTPTVVIVQNEDGACGAFNINLHHPVEDGCDLPSSAIDREFFNKLSLFITKCETNLLELGDADDAISQINILKAATEDISGRILSEYNATPDISFGPDFLIAYRDCSVRLISLMVSLLDHIIGLMSTREIKSKDIFARTLAHEIRTPLTIIDSNCQLLAMESGGISATDCISSIRAAVKHLTEALNRCLLQDRAATDLTYKHDHVDLKALCYTVTDEIQRRTDNHIVKNLPSHLPNLFQGDASLLRILLTNLLDNAVLYSPDGGIIEVSATSEDTGRVVIEVRDEGVGIQDNLLPHIFERFNRIGRADTSVCAGQGLYIVKRIAELHGGTVACESVLGEGSTFRVTLQS